MSKNELLKILQDWNFWENTPQTGVLRPEYTSRIRSSLNEGQVVVITGPRRSGKSYLMRQTVKELIDAGMKRKDVLFINFEDPRFVRLDTQLLDDIFTAYREFIAPEGAPMVFLDEVQEVDGWERWVRSFHELRKGKICVSGSNAKLLSRELGTVLTGRHLDVSVSPLSWDEFRSFKDKNAPVAPLLAEYLESGGFPEVVLSGRKQELLLAYFEDILTKDLIRRFRVRKAEQMKSLAKYYFSNISSLSTFNSLEKSLGINAATIEKFSGYFEDAYLLSFVKRFSWKVREQEKSPRKVYSVDTGLANAVGFRFSQNSGALAENLVFSQLRRRQAADPSLEIYYWKDAQHRETDFVVKQGKSAIAAIQVCWDIRDERVRQRELKSLRLAMDDLGLKEGLVITDDQEEKPANEGKTIRFISLMSFLSGSLQ
ncbi:MAG TPA: ATP-binding protein [Candidatus Omnitrophota bacterium]|nr:ATP-binding protein [Candidatus Omnitrophota bacterium]